VWGWSHTLDYAYGFGNALNNLLSYAKVTKLTPGQFYEYAIYQFDNQAEDKKDDNNYRFGVYEWYINDVRQINGIQEAGPDVPSNDQPTVRGFAMADGNGEITFKFKNNRGNWGSRSCIHINLSGISVVEARGLPPPSPPWAPGATPTLPNAYPSAGLKAWYCPGEYSTSNNVWTDCSGNGNDATLSSGAGFVKSTHYAFQDQTVSSATRVLYGGTSQTINFGQILMNDYTVCSVTRYYGSTRGRILDATGANWLHGHWNGEAGAVHYNTWITGPRGNPTFNNMGSSLGGRILKGKVGYGPAQATDWVVTCRTRGGPTTLLNGVDFGDCTNCVGLSNLNLLINDGEVSDFGVAEVVVWDQDLSDSELQDASNHLMNQMGMSLPRSTTYLSLGAIDENGNCGVKTYHSGGWELATQSSNQAPLSEVYMKWVSRAAHYCLLYDSESTHFTVWENAGYQCFKADSYGKACSTSTSVYGQTATFAIAAASPSPPPSPPLIPTDVPANVVWQSTVHSHCDANPSPGTLQKTSGTEAWTCAAFTNAPPYQIPASGGFRAMEFRCPCTGNQVNIGLQAASADWSTWESSIDRTCNSNGDCGNYYNSAIAYGFSCRRGGELWIHYNGQEQHERQGNYDAQSVLRVEAIGNSVTWYRDGTPLKSVTVSTVDYPLNVFATIHDVDASCISVTDLQLSPPSRYHLRTTQRTWAAAKQACENEGMTLASVLSAEDDQKLAALVAGDTLPQHVRELVWLGGNDQASEGNWVWLASGEPMVYTKWKTGEPNNDANAEDVMGYDSRDGGGWLDAKDHYSKAYVCQELQLSPPSRYHLRTTHLTWQAAKQACIDEGMTLASVLSAEDEQELNTLVVGTGHNFVWLGGNDIASEGDWVWVADGQAFGDYQNWHSGEPNNDGGIEDVMGKDFRDGVMAWVDSKELDHYTNPYVCQE